MHTTPNLASPPLAIAIASLLLASTALAQEDARGSADRSLDQPAFANPPEPLPSARPALDPEQPPRVSDRAEDVWYGWQTLLADGLALGLLVVPSAVDGWGHSDVPWFGFAGLMLATPIVHVGSRRGCRRADGASRGELACEV